MSDVTQFEREPEFLLDLRWILLQFRGDYKASVVWSIIGLITRFCAHSAVIRAKFAVTLPLAAFLADLWLSLPATSHEREVKVLDLLRHATFGVELDRVENYVVNLLPKLLE